MLSGNPQLILFGTDSDLLDNLRRYSIALPYISYETGYGPDVVAKAGLDAIWATLMVGVELFGATPPFPLHEARVFGTPPIQVRRGLPKYGVVGVAKSDDDPDIPEYNLRLVLSALLRAVRDFNTKQSNWIQRVGVLPEDLDLNRLDPPEAFRIIQKLYEGG